MKKGYPAIGIPILDPFLVPKFDVPAISNNFVDADIMVHNVIVQNLSALEVVTGNFFKNILFFIRNYIFLNEISSTGSSIQGGLRTAFDRSDAQRLFLKLSSLVAFDNFLKITPGALISWCALLKKDKIVFHMFLF